MILEVFGLGILIPALSILLDPEMIEKTQLISSLRGFFSEFSHQEFLFFFLILIVVVYFIKILFLIFLTYFQNKFLANVTASISIKLFSNYMSQPYSFHLEKNSSELIKNIQGEVTYLHFFTQALVNIFIEVGFVLSIFMVLIYIEPFGALTIGIFYGLLSVLFFQITKRKLKQWGQTRQELDSKIYKTALEGLGGIKDLLILGKTSFFTKHFHEENFLKAKLNSNHGTVSQIPRFYLELISIIGLVSFIVILILKGNNAATLITTTGVFVAAIFRTLPSINKIIASIQAFKFYMPSVNIVYKELINTKYNVVQSENKVKYNLKDSIELKDLCFSYDGNNKKILKNINLKINRGQTVGIIGESGSGKSTLIDLIVGLYDPTFGQIIIDGNSGLQKDISWKKTIGYVSQSIFLIDSSIKNNIALGMAHEKIDDNLILKVIKEAHLDKFIKNLEYGVDTKVGERGVQLSGGQRQRIGIARALYNNPDILILDEATSALDLVTESEIINSINSLKGQKTIIMVAHRKSTLVNCDFIFDINNL